MDRSRFGSHTEPVAHVFGKVIDGVPELPERNKKLLNCVLRCAAFDPVRPQKTLSGRPTRVLKGYLRIAMTTKEYGNAPLSLINGFRGVLGAPKDIMCPMSTSSKRTKRAVLLVHGNRSKNSIAAGAKP
jgi:hypothetical protein